MGPYLGTGVPKGTFLAFWVPNGSLFIFQGPYFQCFDYIYAKNVNSVFNAEFAWIQRVNMVGLWQVVSCMLSYILHCSQFAWGPTFFKMGTRWGPKFQWNGDQMGTLASRMGTQEAHVCKIDRNKLIRWNIAFIREEKLFFTRTVKLAWDSQVPVVLLQVITFYSGCMDFSRVLKP